MNVFGFNFVVNLGITVLVAVFFVPALLISYSVVKLLRRCWTRFVKWRCPRYVVVDTNSIQSIMDHGRNQGVYTLMVQGRKIDENLRSHLTHLVSTRPFMKMALTTKYGLYAWNNNVEFFMNNHLINSPGLFKGRPINDSNIQDLVSDVTSKFLPQAHSPWQVHVISCTITGRNVKICLVRAHHLLLHQEHLTLADFLPLKYSPGNWACQETDSPFTNLYAEPSALPELHQKLTESFSNYWNEFLCNNDPTERPEILKRSVGIFQCLKIFVIVIVSTLKESTRKSNGTELTKILSIFQREAHKRNLTFSTFFNGIYRSLSPIELLRSTIVWMWYVSVTIVLKTPILVIRELRALKSQKKHYYPDTLTSVIYCYLPLVVQATIEVLSITWIAIGAPRAIIDELFVKHAQSNRLQTISPCGRKVVAWSDEIDVEMIKKISCVTGATETEIMLTIMVASLKEYFRASGVDVPEDVLATAKFVSQRALFVKSQRARGILCLALPTRTPLFEDDLVEILQVTQKNLQDARSKQSAIYAITAAEKSRGLLTSCLPWVFLRIMLRHLTSRYSLALTHVDGELPVEGVDAAIYWSPPQGNCNMSMTLHRHATGVRLGVMTDAMLSPEHSIITKTFPRNLRRLATTLGVPEQPRNDRTGPGPSSPTTSPGY